MQISMQKAKDKYHFSKHFNQCFCNLQSKLVKEHKQEGVCVSKHGDVSQPFKFQGRLISLVCLKQLGDFLACENIKTHNSTKQLPICQHYKNNTERIITLKCSELFLHIRRLTNLSF